MINSIKPIEIAPGQGNIIASFSNYSLIIEMSARDIDYILSLEDVPELFIQLELNENSISLIGFVNQSRRVLYQALTNVPGIGSKSALIILNCGEVVDILRAVSGQDFEFLKEVPGVGEKRIAAIFKELEKKYQKALPKKLPIKTRTWVNVRESLMLSGLDFKTAEETIAIAISETDSQEWTEENLYKAAEAKI